MNIKSVLIMSIIAMFSLNAAAEASKSTIEPFYSFLSNPSSDQHAKKFAASVRDGWKSVGDYSGRSKNRDKFMKQVAGFGQLIPNLKWSIQDVVIGGDKIVVRSRATGTPKGPLFGVDGKGRSFDILTIDIHTVRDGKIVESYHVEDWAGALRQLKAQ